MKKMLSIYYVQKYQDKIVYIYDLNNYILTK